MAWSSVPPQPVTVKRLLSGIDLVARQIVPTDEGKSEAELKYVSNLRRPISLTSALEISYIIGEMFFAKFHVNDIIHPS